MKLENLTRKPTLKQLNHITETRFGTTIDYDNMTIRKATRMSNKIMETVTRIRNSSAIHTAERNPKYLEMLMVYKGLTEWIDSYNVQTKKIVARKLYESEMGQAEAILAAKDMVDSVQDIIGKIGKMQNEQLPALYDTIRDQIGTEQADQFKMVVGSTLNGLIGQLNMTRDQLDNCARGLTGEGLAMQMNVPGQQNGQMDQQAMQSDIPPEMQQGEETDGFNATDAAVGGTEPSGRETR